MTYLPVAKLVDGTEYSASTNDTVLARLADDRITKVVGTILRLEEGAIKFSYQGQEKSISLDKIARLDFGLEVDDAAEVNTANWPVFHLAQIKKTLSVPARLTGVDAESVSQTSVWGAGDFDTAKQVNPPGNSQR